MKKSYYHAFVFLIICYSAIAYAQDKVVVIPLMSDCPDCNAIPTVTSADGRVWMDRNLGARRAAESVDDHQAFGWLYQWGRGSDGHEIRYSPTTNQPSTNDNPGHGAFIAYYFDWRDGGNNSLWQGGISDNNPCPTGFRLPTQTEWETERSSWEGDKDAAAAFASPLKLVTASYRDYNDGGVIDSNGLYWSRTANGSVSTAAIYLNLGTSGLFSIERANGFSVRCIKE